MAKKQRHEEHEEHVDESWLIPYADLLTLLLALFIVLFASGQTDQKKLDQLSESMYGAFNGGKGFFEFFGVIPPSRREDSDSRNRTNEETSGSLEKPERGESAAGGDASGDRAGQTAEELAEAQKQEQENLDSLKQELDTYISHNSLTTQLDTTLGEHYVMITIRDQALFASGSAQIKTEAVVLADAISDILTSYPDYQVTVSGHTDNVPITSRAYQSNWDLSTDRSLNFMKELFRNPDVNQKRFSSSGFGEFRPIATNDTEEGRAQNRRVEVSIISPAVLPSTQMNVR
ncbi:MAG: motB [Paenibacillaceae bacterium]|nr:motB [Paenibacillaceae bacterium]